MSALCATRGADRLSKIETLPVCDDGARIGYVGSIDPTGGNSDWDWGDRQDANGEWILFEDSGAGCIFNFTQHRTKRLKTEKGVTRQEFPVPTYRFYFDGATTPQFEITPEEFGTKAPFLDPLAGSFVPDIPTVDFRIVRSFVPMAYRTSAKVTSTVQLKGKADQGGGWGHVTYHHYDSPDGLETFDGEADGRALQELYSKALAVAHDGETGISPFSLAAGARREVFAAEGRSTLAGIRLKAGGFASATDLASNLWIVCTFDGRTTVEAPAGTFFGCEMPANAAERRLALLTFDTKSEPGSVTLENRFPMPFFSSAKVEVENRGGLALTVEGRVRTNGILRYDPQTTGHFTGSKYLPPTRNVNGKNAQIGSFSGRGQMVYGTFSLRGGTVRGCEGDVRCFIDGEPGPRVQSDGSESWGSWGWGFSRPPQTQPLAAYDAPVSDNTAWSQVRLLIGDCYSFKTSLRFEVEHGDCNDLEGSMTSGQVFGYVRWDHDHEWGAWGEDTATKAAGGTQTRRCRHAGCVAVETRATPQRWDWLETDDRGYFRTGYVPNLRWTKIACKLRFVELNGGNCAVFSANAIQNLSAPRDAYGNLLLLETNDNGTKFDYNNLALDLPEAERKRPGCKPTFDADTARAHVIVTHNSRISIDGEVTEGSEDANDVEAGSDLILFATSYTKDHGHDRSYLNQSKKRIYRLRIWDADASGGETLRHSYRPALNGTVATLWDEVTGEFLSVQNGGVFSVGNDSDVTQDSIDIGLSGDSIVIPSGKTATLEGGLLKVGDKTYEPKAHYVFKAVDGGFALEIAQEEAVIAGIEIGAGGTVTVTSEKACVNFWYALEASAALPFEPVGTPDWKRLDETRTLSVKGDGRGGFYRLKVTDRAE